MNNTISLERLHRALGGDISQGKYGPQVSCPGPGHSHRDRSLAVAPANNADGFIVYSHSKKDDWITAKDYVREKLGLLRFESSRALRSDSKNLLVVPRLSSLCCRGRTQFSQMKIKTTHLVVRPTLKIRDSEVFEKWVSFY
jgi:hypothetical protein